MGYGVKGGLSPPLIRRQKGPCERLIAGMAKLVGESSYVYDTGW